MKLFLLVTALIAVPHHAEIAAFAPYLDIQSAVYPLRTISSNSYSDKGSQAISTIHALMDGIDVRKASDHSSGSNHHVYLKQFVNGLEVVNGNGAVHFSHGNVVSMSHTFHDVNTQPSAGLKFQSASAEAFGGVTDGELSTLEAVQIVADYLSITVETLEQSGDDKMLLNSLPEVDISKKLIQTSSGLRPCFDVIIDLWDHSKNWYNIQIDSTTGEILGLVDWVSKSTYMAFPFTNNDPRDGDRQTFVNPEDPTASKIGWDTLMKDGEIVETGETSGNNVLAQSNPRMKRSKRTKSVKGVFSSTLDLTREPSTYTSASTVNLFYLANKIHDLFYLNGFNEVSGNFQQDNLGKGGRGNDAVVANTQDGSGMNNAWFATPPDGTKGRCAMFLWSQTTPKRDGSFEEGIVVHEFTHGMSTRLTGGAHNSGCLGFGESGGFGEGSGDIIATVRANLMIDVEDAEHYH